MEFLKKLDWLMERDGLNKHTLAQKSGIPYTTIIGLYERGATNARLSTLNKLCSIFDVPLDYLVYDKYEKPEDFVPNGRKVDMVCESGQEIEIISLYRTMNLTGREMLLNTARAFAGNPAMQKDGSNTATA